MDDRQSPVQSEADDDRSKDRSTGDDHPRPVPFRARMSIYLIALAFFGLMACMCAFIFAVAATM